VGDWWVGEGRRMEMHGLLRVEGGRLKFEGSSALQFWL